MNITFCFTALLIASISMQSNAEEFPSQIVIDDASVNENSTIISVRGKYRCGDPTKFITKRGWLNVDITATQAQGRSVRTGYGNIPLGESVVVVCDGSDHSYELPLFPAQLCKKSACSTVVWNRNPIALVARFAGNATAELLACDPGLTCNPECERFYLIMASTIYTLNR